ncbi:MAG: DUF3108 domain-containing protein [Bacillota bacterium]
MKTFFPARQRAASKRGIALLAASVVLHAVAFEWAAGRLGMPSWPQQKEMVMTTELLPAPPAPRPAIAPPKPKPKPKPKQAKPRRASPPPTPVAQAAPSPTALTPPEPEAVEAAPEAAAMPAGASDAAEAASAGAAQGAAADAPQEAAPASYKFDPPPSAELTYDVKVLREGQTWHGSGLYRWEATHDSYTATIEAGVTILFRITVLNLKSEGRINDLGLAPVLYSEKPWRKAMTNTHFQHENRKISFSASEAVYPYNGGEQDRASVIWQLAGIGRADVAQFRPGATFDLFVAGPRDAETWHFTVVGAEDIDTPNGKLGTWHVKRLPKPGSYDRTIDIWFAPQQEWYPVKVRETYRNGDYYDLSLAKAEPVAAH